MVDIAVGVGGRTIVAVPKGALTSIGTAVENTHLLLKIRRVIANDPTMICPPSVVIAVGSPAGINNAIQQ